MNITMILGIDFLKPYVDGRVYREARSLTAAGHNVTIICWARTITNETTSSEPAQDEYEGINIKRVFSPISPIGSSLIVRVNQHLSAMRAIAKEIKATESDALHFHDFNTLFTLRYLKNNDLPVIYDSHEDFINMLDDVLPGYLLWFARRKERKLIKKVDWAITISEPVAESLREYGAKKTVLVMNCRDLDDYDNASKKNVKELKAKLAPGSEVITLYIGSIGNDRDLKTLVEVFKLAENDSKYSKKLQNVKLVAGGFGHLEARFRDCVASLKNAEWTGFVPGEKLIEHNLASDIMVVLFNPARPSQGRTLPNKLFEAMAAGKPIIVCRGTEGARIVEEEECGLSVTYGDKKSLADAIVRLAGDPALREKLGKKGYAAAKNTYNWRSQEARLLEIYNSITKNEK